MKLTHAQQSVLGMLASGYPVTAERNPSGTYTAKCEYLPVIHIGTLDVLKRNGLVDCAGEQERTYVITHAGKLAMAKGKEAEK